jgi:hypothetical protein
LRGESLDHSHGAAAVGTEPGACGLRYGPCWHGRSRERSRLQQSPAEGQQFAAAPVREEAAEADTDKAPRQGVEQETPQKLFGGHGHQPLLALVGIIFPAEGDLAIRKVHNPVIGDGHAMRVAGQIVEDMFGSSEWPFGVNYPYPANRDAHAPLTEIESAN